jgi:hypothetical protein
MVNRGISGTRAGMTFAAAVDHLLPDEDATVTDDRKWLAERHTEKIVDVERRFNLPPGSLRRAAAAAKQPPARTDR